MHHRQRVTNFLFAYELDRTCIINNFSYFWILSIIRIEHKFLRFFNSPKFFKLKFSVVPNITKYTDMFNFPCYFSHKTSALTCTTSRAFNHMFVCLLYYYLVYQYFVKFPIFFSRIQNSVLHRCHVFRHRFLRRRIRLNQ